MRDFTLKTFELMCSNLKKLKYEFITFTEYYLGGKNKKLVMMRHDVDKSWSDALRMANIEAKNKIRATYFFRHARKCFNESAIKKIAALGHEIGYHYEDLSSAKGNYDKAIITFKKNLYRFREIVPVRTICMHGSPLSKWDNRLLWQKFNYREFSIIGEPYFDIDYSGVLYLTDTGRTWDGDEITVRDKVVSKYDYRFKSTFQILGALNDERLPDQLIINIHPHRWVDNQVVWLKELIWQNVKNNIKKYFFVKP
jgi:hypothetical protein